MYKYLATLALAIVAFLGSFAQTTAKEWYDKGISLKDKELYTSAITAFKKAAALKTNYADAWYQLGWCYNEEGLYKEAIDALQKEAKAGSSDVARNHFEMGYAYNGLKKYEDAIVHLTKAIDMDEEYTLAYKERGTAYYKLKQYDKVLSDYDAYEDLVIGEIKDADYFYRRGWTENEQARYKEAVQSLKKAAKLDDRFTSAFTELGYSYYKLKENTDAIRSYRTAMHLDPGNSDPSFGIADTYFDNVKDYDSAIVYYEKGLHINKKDKAAWYRLGWSFNDKKQYTKAVNALKEALLLDENYDKAKTELGYAYYKLEKYDDALAQFKPLMIKNPKDELSRYYAGFCYYLKDDQAGLKKMIAELHALNSTKYVETLKKYVK